MASNVKSVIACDGAGECCLAAYKEFDDAKMTARAEAIHLCDLLTKPVDMP